jgi:outer membrane receptor for ferrienterochelin and colicin
MLPSKGTFALAIVIACWLRAAPSLAAEPTTSTSPDTAKRGGGPSAKTSDIEDTALEGLLGMNLEDKLGTTEAVSRKNESVLRAPATITTLDSTQIRLSGASTVPEVLRFVPGVAVYRSAPNNYVVALRGTGGLSGNNIVLLIDGIPINSPLDGEVSWDLIPLQVEDIERIEVVRGPVSPIYGANAYTGVINIVTRTSLGLTPGYVARIRGGSDLGGNPKGSVSGRFMHVEKNLDFKWFLNAEHDGTSAKPVISTTAAHEHPSPADRFAMTAIFGFAPTKKSRLSFELGQSWSRRSSMQDLVLDSVPQAQTLQFGRALYELRDLGGPLTSVRLWVQGTSLRMNADTDQHTGLSFDGTHVLRGVAGTDLVFGLNKSFSVLLGGQTSLERMDALYLHPNADDTVRSAYGFYGGINAVLFSSLDVSLTGRGDLAPISAKIEYSYRASAIYHTDTWALRLTGASAFRTPSYVEATGRFVDPTSHLIFLEGSASIGAPRNTSVELGATFSPHSTLTISPTVYVSRLSNLMVEDFQSLVRRTFRNDIVPRQYAGGELEANWRATEAVSVLPSFTILHWFDTSKPFEANVGVPDQNSRYMGGLRLQGVFGNDRWGYGMGAMIVGPRKYDIRAGVPVVRLSKNIPTSAYLTAMLEHQLTNTPSMWLSLRLNASLPTDVPESPQPLASPLGQSAILGFEIRTE